MGALAPNSDYNLISVLTLSPSLFRISLLRINQFNILTTTTKRETCISVQQKHEIKKCRQQHIGDKIFIRQQTDMFTLN